MKINSASFERKVELLIVDPPNNTCRQAGKSDSEYYVFKKQSMADILDLSEAVLKPVAYRSVFCSALHCVKWAHTLEWQTKFLAALNKDGDHDEEREIVGYEM